jgi:protein disulfide-isomerase
MFTANPSSLFFPSKPSTLRCRAAGDIPAGPAFPRWFQFPSPATAEISGGVRIGHDADATAGDGWSRRGVAAGGSNGVKVNAREKKWSRRGESYLADDSDALPLPMTHPDSSPVPPEEIDRRLRCNPQVEVLFLSSIFLLFIFAFSFFVEMLGGFGLEGWITEMIY